jgi:hypothetical protein
MLISRFRLSRLASIHPTTKWTTAPSGDAEPPSLWSGFACGSFGRDLDLSIVLMAMYWYQFLEHLFGFSRAARRSPEDRRGRLT